MKKIVTGCLMACIICLILAGSTQTVTAKEVSPMKVAWFYQPGYQELTKNNSPYGYNYEYLMQIAQYTGWSYEFVQTDSFSDAYQMLKNGEVDLLGYLLYSDERSNEITYAELDCGDVTTSLFVKSDSQIASYDFEAFDSLTVACMNSQNITYLTEYAEKNGFSVKIKYYSNLEQIEKAVLEGEADAGLNGGYDPKEGIRIVASFSPKPFYFAMPKGRSEKMAQMNYALNSIRIDNPYYERDLAYKYIRQVKDTLHLTNSEKRFVEKKNTITVAFHKAWQPIEVYDEKTNTYSGITADIFQRISEITGLTFQYQGFDGKENTSDIIAGVQDNFAQAEKNGYMLTRTYLNVPLVSVKKEEHHHKGEETVAVMRHIYLNEETTQNAADSVVYYDTLEECLDAVLYGDSKEAVINTYSAEYMLTKSKYKSLYASTLYNEYYSLCVGVSKYSDPELASILNKALNLIPESEIDAIVFQNTERMQEINIETIISEMPPDVIWVFSLLLVAAVVILSILIKRQRNYAAYIKKLLYTDELTGLLSFKGFEAKTEELLNSDIAGNKKLYLIDFDVNHFEEYNTINGYQAGNELLCTIARISRDECGDTLLCTRIQADHFVVLTRAFWQQEVIENIKQALEMLREKMGSTSLLISYGIYEIPRGVKDVVKMCDCALAAKRTVKGNYEKYIAVFDEKIRKNQLEDMEILNRFEKSLKDGELVVYYQPKHHLDTGEVTGAEALVRWFKKEGGLISPERFVELLEVNGLILKLDLYMFEKVCEKLGKMARQGGEMISISVNISRAYLYDSQYVQKLSEIAKKYEVPQFVLEIEITETAFMDNPHELIVMMGKMHEAGFLVAIDDFGSGFSSLNMLKDLPVDVIKLDRAFLTTTSGTRRGEKIIKNILQLARELDIVTVAEGVETLEQLLLLKGYHCDIAQGFYYAKPMPEEEFDSYLETQKKNSFLPC